MSPARHTKTSLWYLSHRVTLRHPSPTSRVLPQNFIPIVTFHFDLIWRCHIKIISSLYMLWRAALRYTRLFVQTRLARSQRNLHCSAPHVWKLLIKLSYLHPPNNPLLLRYPPPCDIKATPHPLHRKLRFSTNSPFFYFVQPLQYSVFPCVCVYSHCLVSRAVIARFAPHFM